MSYNDKTYQDERANITVGEDYEYSWEHHAHVNKIKKCGCSQDVYVFEVGM